MPTERSELVERLERRVKLVSLDDDPAIRGARLDDLLMDDAEEGPGRAVIMRYDDFHELQARAEAAERALEEARAPRCDNPDCGWCEYLHDAMDERAARTAAPEEVERAK